MMQKEQLFLKLLRVSDIAKPRRIKKKKKGEKRDGVYHLGLSDKVILRILLEEKRINQRSIAKIMKITAQAVSEIIKKLVEMEFVYKEQGLSHNENFILLTDKGEERAKSLHVEFEKDAENFLESLSLTEEELLILDVLLTKVFDSYNEKDE